MRAELHSFPPFRLDAKNEQLWRGNEEVRLRRKTFAVLRYLVERPGELVTKAALLDAVWPDVSVSDSMPAISVRELRRALGDDAQSPRFIETVRGRGYRFIAEVRLDSARTHAPMAAALASKLVRAPRNSFVGREPERAELGSALTDAISGRGRLALVSGEPGIGKSRLCAEIAEQARAKGMAVLVGHSSEQEAVPYLPFVEILESCVEHTEDIEELRRAIGEEGPELARLLPRLMRMLPGLPPPLDLSPAQARRQLFDSVCNFVARQADQRPLLLILEDLHWADDSTLALFSHLAERHAQLPLLLIGTHRVSEADVGPSLARTLEDLVRGRLAAQVRLEGLAEDGIALMLKDLGGKAPPPAIVHEFRTETDGNPFFVEELFHHLAEENRLYDPSGRYRAELKIEEPEAPQNVRLIVGRRFKRLSDATAKVLVTAAVIGRSFAFELLEASTKLEPETLLDSVDEAGRVGLIRSSTEYADARIEFSHELIRQVVLAQLSAARRRRLHLQVGEAIERLYSDSVEDHYAELAHHYEQTADTAKAVHYLCLAGYQALQRSAHVEAIALLSSGLERLKTLADFFERDRIELKLQLAIGSVTIALKGFSVPEVENAYSRAVTLCRRLDDRPNLIAAQSGLAVHHMLRSRLRKGLEIGKEVLALTRETDSAERQATAFFHFAMPSFWLGDLEAAREYLEKAIALIEPMQGGEFGPVGTGGMLPGSLQYLAWTLWYMGYPDRGLGAARRALAVARLGDDAFALASALNQVARFHILRREASIALGLANEGLALATSKKFPTWAAESMLVRGWALAYMGRDEEGIAELRAGLAARDSIREFGAQPHYRAWLAEACARIGHAQEGLDLITPYLNKEHEVLVYEPEVHLARASLLLVQDPTNTADAIGSVRTAIEIAKRYSSKSFELRATTVLARLLEPQGKREDTRAMLSDIYNWFTEGFDTADLKDAKALLDELSH